MAKTPTKKKAAKSKTAPAKKKAAKSGALRKSGGTARAKSGPGAADAFVNLLQSPLVADLVAVAATAAIAALAAKGAGSGKKKASGSAVKAAGAAAAAAVGRRLSEEIDEIRKSSKAAPKA